MGRSDDDPAQIAPPFSDPIATSDSDTLNTLGDDHVVRVLGLIALCACGRINFGLPGGGDAGDAISTPTTPWTRFFTGSGRTWIKRVAVGPDGAVVATGEFAGDVDIDGRAHAAIGPIDLIVARFAVDGSFTWSQRYGGTAAVDGRDIGFDAMGRVSVHGLHGGTTTFGTIQHNAGTGQDAITLGHDASGMHERTRAFISGGANAQGRGLNITSDGRVLTSGSYEGSVSIGTTPLPDQPGMAAYLAELDPSGNTSWVSNFSATSRVAANDIDLAEGLTTPCTAGDFAGDANFNGTMRTSAGLQDGFVVGLSSSGATQWVGQIGSAGTDFGTAVVGTANGDCIVVGYAATGVDFGAGQVSNAGAFDAFIARYGPGGTLRWAKLVGGAGDDGAFAVDEAADGAILIGGTFAAQATFLGQTLTAAGQTDAFLLVLEADGSLRSARAFGGIGDETVYGVAFDHARSAVAIGGEFTGDTAIDGATKSSGFGSFIYWTPY